MSWYLENGKESDVVISSRIRFARNIKGIPFKAKMTKQDEESLLKKVKYIVPTLGYNLNFLKLSDMDDITKLSLVEKNIISPEMLVNNNEQKAILINEDENISILINEEDHIRLQVFSSGLDLQNILNLAIEIDEKIDETLNYSCSKKYGYLTSCPTNVGTGLRASVIVHLKALRETGNISKILKAVNSFGMTLRSINVEDSQNIGDMYEIFNNQTLGMTENEIIENLESITKKVVEQERLARKYLCNNKIEIEDKVYRSYGILTNAVKISLDETIKLISDVKLGVDLGLIDKINDIKIKKLMIYTKPASMQKYIGSILNAYDRDIKRAEIVKQIVNEKK